MTNGDVRICATQQDGVNTDLKRTYCGTNQTFFFLNKLKIVTTAIAIVERACKTALIAVGSIEAATSKNLIDDTPSTPVAKSLILFILKNLYDKITYQNHITKNNLPK